MKFYSCAGDDDASVCGPLKYDEFGIFLFVVEIPGNFLGENLNF